MPTALNSPHGARPSSLAKPIPGQDQEDDLSDYIKPAKGPKEMPQSPMAAPAPEAPPEEDLSEYLGAKNPQKADPNDVSDYLGTKNEEEGYQYVGQKIRYSPAGGVEFLAAGKWSPAPAVMGDAVMDFVKNDLPRAAGGTAGMMAGEAVGSVAGPVGAVVGGVVGSAAGTAAGGALADYAQGKPSSMKEDAALGAIGGMIPPAMSKFLAAQAAQWAGRAALAPSVNVGGELIASKVAKRIGAAEEYGVALRADQASPENMAQQQAVAKILKQGGPEVQKLVQMEAAQQEQLRTAWDRVKEKTIGPYEFESTAQGGKNFHEYFGKIMDNVETSMATTTKRIADIAGDRKFNGDVSKFLGKTKDRLSESLGGEIFLPDGSVSSKALEARNVKLGELSKEQGAQLQEYIRIRNALKEYEVQNQAGGNKGWTIGDLNTMRKTLQGKGKFRQDASDADLATWRGMAHDMRVTLDEASEAAVKDTDPALAEQLRASKDFYSQTKETMENFQKLVEKDPHNAALALIDPKNPAKVRQLMSVLEPKQQAALRGGALDALTQPMFDPTTGRFKMTASEAKWRGMDPAVKEAVFGENARSIDKLIYLSKAIEARPLAGYVASEDPLVKNFIKTVKTRDIGGAMSFVRSLFPFKPEAADVIIGHAYEKLVSDGVSAAEKAQAKKAAAQAWMMGSPASQRVPRLVASQLIPEAMIRREIDSILPGEQQR